MSNTDHNMHNINHKNKYTDGNISHDTLSLPPLPPANARGKDVCAIIQLYLGVWHDLTAEQQYAVSQHVSHCPDCTAVYRLLKQSTELVARLDGSVPSQRVDQAVHSAIVAREAQLGHTTVGRISARHVSPLAYLPEELRRRQRRTFLKVAGGAVAAGAVAAFTGVEISMQNAAQSAFSLPASLTWNSYVLYNKQTVTNTQGERYYVMSYHDMQSGSMNVETLMPGKLDVVMVKQPDRSVGLDMMHHVAEYDVSDWGPDGPSFNLQQLRSDLKSGRAAYQGKGTFNGQPVYRIRYVNDQVLLLDMDYMPVNVLEPEPHSSNEQPMYDTVQWLQPSKVAASTWDASVPPGFKMGSLPPKPQA